MCVESDCKSYVGYNLKRCGQAKELFTVTGSHACWAKIVLVSR